MNKKVLIFTCLVLFTASVVLSTAVEACGKDKKGHDKKKGSISCKILKKAHFLLKNQDELGLSAKQVKNIKELKISTKKNLIKRKAEIELLGVDMKAKLYDDKIDLKAINKLIDEKYALKKAKAKSLVATYANLKGMITKEQYKRMKTLWKNCDK